MAFDSIKQHYAVVSGADFLSVAGMVLLTVAGIWVSMKPPQKTWLQRTLAICFLLFGVLAITASLWQVSDAKIDATKAQTESKKIALGDAERPPFLAVISLPGFTRFVTTNGSDYPAYGTKIQVYDTASNALVRSYDYPEMAAHLAFLDDKPWTPPVGAVKCRFTAQITTRTGFASEELILRLTDTNQWMRASRVMQGPRTLEEDVDSAWPRDRNGQIDWN